MKYLGDIKIQTAADVNEALDHIMGLENGLNAVGIGPIMHGWMETRLKRNLEWISTSRKELQDAKDMFKNDFETKKKIEDGLNKLHTIESRIQDMIRRSEVLKAKQGQKNANH
ncbi:hypothetical protein F4776DRAFT_606106 [Hypoxylon sp. NC0597]|nr:hypothetical protein F4776DRAFT_606106 [Hypoxylon sp. NC0597]